MRGYKGAKVQRSVRHWRRVSRAAFAAHCLLRSRIERRRYSRCVKRTTPLPPGTTTLCATPESKHASIMSIYSPPPPLRSFRDDQPTLLVCWWCTIFAAVVILFRVCGRYVRTERLFREDWIAFACLIPLFIRMAFVHVVLLFGTNNVITDTLTDREIYRREVGSRLVLASRIFLTMT